jgi:two-component system, OmpR family, catabolic regulation response regulator CreB
MAWRGSIVNFFPIYAPGGQDNGAALDDYHDRGGFGMEKRILLVEDNAQFTEIFKQAVGQVLAPERLDVAFVEAGSLAEARARLGEGGLDAALIDVGLPDGDGLDLVREIYDGGPGAPIPTLVLTANLDHSVAARAIEAGAQGALSKMVSVPETLEAIKRLTVPGRSES